MAQETGTSNSSSFPAIVSCIAVAVLVGYGYLTFVFPRIVAAWSHRGAALSRPQVLLVQLSQLCRRSGILGLALMVTMVVGCVIWAMAGPRESESQE